MADLFDRFSGAAGNLTSHTADSGDTWGPSGDTSAQTNGSGAAYVVSGDADLPYSSWTPPGTDYAVSIVAGSAVTVTEPPYIQIGPAARCSGSSGAITGYFCGITPASPPNFRFQVYLSGTLSLLTDEIDLSAIAANDVFTLTATGTGPVVLTLYQNGTQVGTYTDSSGSAITSAGSAGIWLYQASGFAGGTDFIRTLWTGSIGGPSASISPNSATVTLSGTEGFTAGGTLPNESIDWTADSGSVSPSTGSSTTYTAPASGSSDTVTWTSEDLPTHTASAAVTLSASGTTTFHIPENNASSTVGMTRAAGSPTLELTDGSTFGTDYPKIVTVSRSGAVLCILEATARSSNTLTISGAIEGTTDTAMNVGDTVDLRPTKLAITEIQGAVTGLEGTVGGLGGAHRDFGAAGTAVLNATTRPVYLDRAGVCNGLAAACGTAPSGGSATVTIESSADGTTWSTLASVSIASGAYSGTASATSALSSGTFLRGKFTAVNGVADITATLYLQG